MITRRCAFLSSKKSRRMAILRSCVIALLLFLFVMCTSSRSQKQKLHILKRYSSKAQGVLTKEYSDPMTFKDLLKPILVPRMPDTDAIRAVQKHIVDILKKRNWHVELDTFQENTPYGVKTFTNIIATYNPLAPQKLVLAAHYDSKNITDRRYPNKQFIGATDSAVPCAILLDLAVQLDCLFQKGRGNKASDITPQLVFFDGEEAFKDWTDTDSIYGARHLAEKWSQPDPLDNSHTVLQSIKVFVLLDLIGTADIQFLNFFKKTFDLFEELVKIETELGKHNLLDSTGLMRKHRLFRSNENLAYPRGEGGGIEDDHIPFLRKGVPILHLISAPFPSVWHKMSDNGDAIDYQVTENFNRIFRVFVASYLHLDALYGSCRRKKK